jgi:hypothetical protein
VSDGRGEDDGGRRDEKLEELLGDLPATPVGATPSDGWQDRVLAAIDAEEARRAAPWARARRWVPWLVPLGVAIVGAAAAGSALWLHSEPPRAIAAAPILEVHVEAAGASLPSMAPAMVGDAVVIRGAVDGAAELRVYDDAGAELVRCSAPAADCRMTRSGERTALQLTMTLRMRGAFHPLLFAPPLPGPSAGLERDVAAAHRVSLDVIRVAPVIVP